MENLAVRIAGRGHKGLRKENAWGTLFALIPLAGFVLFSLVPIGITVAAMFSEMPDGSISSMRWIGLDNFEKAFTDPRFGKSILISAYVTVAHVIGLVLALGTSAVLSQKIKGSKLFTTLFFIPYICSSVAVSLMWLKMFDGTYGIINAVLRFLGGDGVDWMHNKWAFTPMLIIVLAWQAPGYGIVMYTAALTGVNPNLYEAARIDGAGRWKQFTAITLPAISPTTFFLILMGLINGMQTFDVANMFGGDTWTGAAGPDDMGLTTVLYIYNTATTAAGMYMPVASVMSFALFLLIMAITAVSFKLSSRLVSYD